MIPLDERPDETHRRLAALAEVELEQARRDPGIEATAMDGSLGSGRVWPSSDIDLTVVSLDPEHIGVRWGIRDGLVVHEHKNNWEWLEHLQKGYPESFIETAAGEWIRDPTWALDGLASMRPVHDPGGRLHTCQEYLLERRFHPDVVEPRRPLLMNGAARRRQKALAAFAEGDERSGTWQMELACEGLALIWLEAAELMISHKELDPALAMATETVGVPEAHALFRGAAGVAGLKPHLADVKAAFGHLLDLYSGWLDALLAHAPSGDKELDHRLATFVYHRHCLWSARYAAERGCWLHLAAIRLSLTGGRACELEAFTEKWRSAACPGEAAPLVDFSAIQNAEARVLDCFPIPPWKQRRDAIRELEALTVRTFFDEAALA